jgi:catechol 2,3-dioxygenase-like lactoylglutathione lyase family enzyme
MEDLDMTVNRMTGSLLVKSYDDAFDFYVGKLGFEVVEDLEMGTDRWVTIARPGASDFVIALHLAQGVGDAALVGKQGGSFPLFGIKTGDCVAEYQRLKSLGVKFYGEPVAQPYGTGVLLEDLYGNQIFLNEEPL